jgi:iron complex transport system ATP-binding protein
MRFPVIRRRLTPVRGAETRRTDASRSLGPRQGEVAIEVCGLEVRYGDHLALRGVDVEVRTGELLALVGPNGAGKSTLLSVLAGDLSPTAGTARLHGRDLAASSPLELARLRAVLPQTSTVAFPFTVADVVRMGRAPWLGTPEAAADDAEVEDAMRRTDVTRLAHRVVPSLSGGEQARVALARVLAQRTPIVLLDEPTSALDLHHQEATMALAQEQARRGDAVVVVLHDLGLAAAYADRVAVVSRGTIRAFGTPDEVLRPRLLSEIYAHELELVVHPGGGAPLIVPKRRPHGLSAPLSKDVTGP